MVRFISFEGGDGSGKTTQIRTVESYLHRQSRSCVVTREPGATPLGALIRKALLEVGEAEIADPAELFLYLADRAQHVQQIIAPALARGEIVLCDRFTDSTLAYQGYGRGIDLGSLQQLNEMASGGIHPDLTFLFDCSPEVGLARAADRRRRAGEISEDRFEREELEFHRRVRGGFLEMALREPKRFRVIDAGCPAVAVTEQVREVLDRELAQ